MSKSKPNRFSKFPGQIKEESQVKPKPPKAEVSQEVPEPPKVEKPVKPAAKKPAKKKVKKEVVLKGIMFKIPESTHTLLKIMGAVMGKKQSELMNEALVKYAESVNKDHGNAFTAFIKSSKQDL